MALPSLETPGQAHSGDSQMPRHTHRLNSFHFGGQTTPLFPSNSPAGELKLPYITAQNFAKGPTSLVDYSRTMVIDNRPVSVAPSFLVGWWKECVATYVYSPDLQQNLLHQVSFSNFSPWYERSLIDSIVQIRSPAFFNFCLDRGLINAAVPVDTSLPVFERWPLVHPDRHPTVLVRMLNGGRFAVPYYGHSSIDCLDYMHLVKHLPQIRKEKIMYTIYEGLVKNLFHFETDKKKKLALARVLKSHYKQCYPYGKLIFCRLRAPRPFAIGRL